VRIGLRQIANVALLGAVSTVAVLWAVLGLAEVRLDDPKVVTVHLVRSGGALAGGEVTYLGVPVGTVARSRLTPSGVELRLSVRPKGPMAAELRADVRQKSALGEIYVDLAPARPGAPVGDPHGAVVPVERATVPRPISTLLHEADAILTDVRGEDLAAVVDGLSGVVGHEADLRALFAGAADLGEVLGRRSAELGELLAASATLAEALDRHRHALGGAVSGYARLGQVLAARRAELGRILAAGGDLGDAGSDLLARTRQDLDGVLAGLDVTFRNLADRPGKVAEIVDLVPAMVDRFGRTFEGGYFWLSAGGATPFFPGYQPRYGVPIYGTGLNLDRIFIPTVAQRIDVDLGGRPPVGFVRLLGPEDSAVAAASPAGFLAVQAREQQRLERAQPAVTP